MTLRDDLPQLRFCPICQKDLPVDAFGISRSRPDSLSLYCKECVRIKVAAHRKGLKDYRDLRRRHRIVIETNEAFEAKEIRKKPPTERVLYVIEHGARTQAEISHYTRLGKDEVGDAIATLLLWTKEIRTQVIEGERLYFKNEPDRRSEVNYQPAVSWIDLSMQVGQLKAGELHR